MEQFITSGAVASVILGVMGVEAAVLGFVLWRRGRAVGLYSFLASLLAGASLVLALQAALTQAGWLYVATYLLSGLLAHVAEIALRLLPARDGSDGSTPRVSQEP